MLAKSAHTWRFLTAAPPREVFSVMEQLLGIPPYRFEVLDDHRARILEYQRRGLFGGWGRVRASNTQPLLVLRWEATSEPRLREIQRLIEGTVEQIRKELA